MNNIVGPIFNEKVAEKWSLWNLWTGEKSKVPAWKKKKKDETCFASRHGCKCSTQTGTKQFFFLATYFVLLIITERSWDQIIEIVQFFQLWMKTYCQCLNS